MKNWEEIVRDLSSPEASDEEDSLNIMSVQRNARRVAELLHGTIPGLDETQMRDLPAGANKLDFMRVGLANAMREASRRSHEASNQSWDALLRGGSVPPPSPVQPAPPPSPVSAPSARAATDAPTTQKDGSGTEGEVVAKGSSLAPSTTTAPPEDEKATGRLAGEI